MPTNPPRWDDAQLDRDRLQAIANFIEARQSQLAPRYRRILRENLRSAITLFRATNNLLDLHTGLALAHDPALTGIARYTAGPLSARMTLIRWPVPRLQSAGHWT